MIGVLLLTIGVALIAYAFYKSTTNSARYFEERNLKYVGLLAGLPNIYKMIFKKTDILELSLKGYDLYPKEAIYGSFDLTTRLYIIRDPDAYKQIAIKEFDHFEDHRSVIDETMDEIWGNTLISLRGEKWRQMRATLSPAFTGSKMRQMFVLVSECADEIVQHFTKKSIDNGERLDIEMKDFFSRYTNDVIATCAFGIEVNSFADPNNEFYSNGIKVMKFGGFTTFVKFLFALIMPKAAKYLKISAIDQTVSDSFRKIVLDTMEMRKKNNIYRPDMINIMMQVREGSLQHAKEEKSNEAVDGFAAVEESEVGKMTNSRKWTDNEIVAQCILFFLAGFETSSTVLTFAAYELVVNPDVQQKLYEEIVEVDKQLGGARVSYDVLQKMKYLDQFISETLRMWPAAFQTDRICVKDYIFDDGNLKFKIEKGSNVIFPIVGVQRDPKFFPQPDKFDPERFNDENKHNIRPGTYTPFGEGPRNCIGSRFALMEIKAILYYLLLKFSFEVNKDTQIPLKMKKGVMMVTEKGVHVQLKPRVNSS